MVLSGLTVGAAVTPTVIETIFSHYLHRKPLHEKPTAHISYHIGLQLVRKFITFSSHHTVEELQSFTSQWIPSPRWIRTEDVILHHDHIEKAAMVLQSQLGHQGIKAIGGYNWWQWRQDGNPLQAEWIEMRKHYDIRIESGESCSRCMLYVHGGAYYFGSVDEHRYQMQRHARKLQARVFAPRYRLAPQYPFPCGLLDCLAVYLFLLTVQPPNTIVLAGDSAGGGMIVSMLVVLRDQGIPLPAGAILLSPWVDLTHSFPSVAGWNEFDYVPPHGFLHKPSNAWPPPNSDDLKALQELSKKGADLERLNTKEIRNSIAKEVGRPVAEENQEATQGFSIHPLDENERAKEFDEVTSVRNGSHDCNLSIVIDEKAVEIKDQVQIYTTNLLLSHPLVSPVLQPSLGGLPPLLILVGGGEMLRDEQIFLAHKAANPTNYPPSPTHLAEQGTGSKEQIGKWPPTNVQLQVWEDLCHVAPTLSFTRPAKYMYRSVAQFGAWSLARAQKRSIEILDDDDISVISSRSSSRLSSRSSSPSKSQRNENHQPRQHLRDSNIPHPGSLSPPNHITSLNGLETPSSTFRSVGPTSSGKAGAPLTPFKAHMIRQLVDRHGNIFPLAPAATLPACNMNPEDIGVIKPGPVGKWLEAQRQWGKRYAKEKRSLQAQRIREMQGRTTQGDSWFGRGGRLEGENPPPTAMVGRVARGGVIKHGEGLRGKKAMTGSKALKVWSGWGSMHDENAIEKEEEKERQEEKQDAAYNITIRKTSVAVQHETRSHEDGTGHETTTSGHSLDVPVNPTAHKQQQERRPSRSRMRSVVDEGQIPHGTFHDAPNT